MGLANGTERANQRGEIVLALGRLSQADGSTDVLTVLKCLLAPAHQRVGNHRTIACLSGEIDRTIDPQEAGSACADIVAEPAHELGDSALSRSVLASARAASRSARSIGSSAAIAVITGRAPSTRSDAMKTSSKRCQRMDLVVTGPA